LAASRSCTFSTAEALCVNYFKVGSKDRTLAQARSLRPGDTVLVERARWLDENLNTSRLRVFVAEDNERFVGFAITMEVPASLRLAHFWQIRDLFVLPTHRRLGVGRALLASVRAAAIASGALRLVLQTEDDNDPALRLYADSGYAMIKGYCSLILPLDP